MDSLIDSLPEDCLCRVMSLTSPRDAYNFSLASTNFRSVVDSDVMWQAFLPSDYATILSRVVDPIVFTSKKDLFFKLSEKHVLIDGGKISFGLDRSSGVKCYMISTNSLKIALSDAPFFYWRPISLCKSRFAEVAMRIFPSRIDIVGKIDSKTLSNKTRYGAYLVYKLIDTFGDISLSIGRRRQQTSVTIGRHVSKSMVYLEPFYGKYMRSVLHEKPELKVPYEKLKFDNYGEITAKERDDEWIEVEMGEFYIDKEDGDVEMKFQSMDRSIYESVGIIVQGIEIKPKH